MQPSSLKSQELNAQVQYRLIEELSASEARYRDLVERIREVVFRCDPEGKLLFLNAAWTTLLGYPIADSLGRPLVDFVAPEDRDTAFRFTTDKACGEECDAGVEVRFMQVGGQEVWLRLAVQSDGAGGKVGSLYDIDDRRRAQESLVELNGSLESRVQQRTAELAETNRKLGAEIEARKQIQEDLLKAERLAVVGETSGRVAHEVLNPITSIYSRMEHNANQWKEFSALLESSRDVINDWQQEHRNGTLSEYLASESEDGSTYGDEDFALLKSILDKQREFQDGRENDIRFVIRQLQRVIKIINNLRGAVRQNRMVSEILLSAPIVEAYEVMQDSLVKRKIRIVNNTPSNLPPVMADENELIQVFTNLFRNAMQSIEERNDGGGYIETSAKIAGEWIEVRVKDSGTGIPFCDQGAIFDFNFSTKDRGQGTGMGLGISRRFVRENGGDMVLENSTVGQGSTFLIRLPLAG